MTAPKGTRPIDAVVAYIDAKAAYTVATARLDHPDDPAEVTIAEVRASVQRRRDRAQVVLDRWPGAAARVTEEHPDATSDEVDAMLSDLLDRLLLPVRPALLVRL